jgi:hypothetical protein
MGPAGGGDVRATSEIFHEELKVRGVPRFPEAGALEGEHRRK